MMGIMKLQAEVVDSRPETVAADEAVSAARPPRRFSQRSLFRAVKYIVGSPLFRRTEPIFADRI
jgi:hypothetical protein